MINTFNDGNICVLLFVENDRDICLAARKLLRVLYNMNILCCMPSILENISGYQMKHIQSCGKTQEKY